MARVEIVVSNKPDNTLTNASGTEARLAELAALEPGWLDRGEGAVVSPAVLHRARLLALSLDQSSAKLDFRIYPTVEGGVQFEWSERNSAVEVVICPDGSTQVYRYEW
jgi:hypothetical protein